MKAKFNTLTGIFIGGVMALSCSAPRSASAQQPDEYNTQQPPADDQQQYDDQGAQTDVDQQQDVDFNSFYDALAPYGEWQDDAEYGKVWVNNDANFVPYYSDGNWAYSDAGWTWASNYSWGWAPFHYGRWAFRNRWVWVPGYEWAPAWVSWRTGGDYYGWAPLGPGVSIGIGASFGGYIAADHWNFCPRQYITSGRFNSYCIPRERNVTIIRNTTIITNVNRYHNTRFVAGPDRRDVERYTGRRINAMPIRNMNRPGATRVSRNSIQMYRPNVRQGNANSNNRLQQRPNTQNQRPVQQQPNISRQQRENRLVQNNPVPYRPNQQQPANQQPRQPVYNRPQQNTINNRQNNNIPDRRTAFNNRPQVQPQQEYRQPERQQVQQPRERAQVQQPRPQFSRPQQQQARPQFQQSRPQAQPRNNDGGQNRNNGGNRERSNRRG